ncbi:MAG: hypothetical protein ACE5HB_08145 [Terriglobia bacterium]
MKKAPILFLIVLGLLLLGTGSPVPAQRSPADDEAIRALYTEFFEALRQAGVQGAIGYLRQSGTIAEDDLQALERKARAAIEGNPLIGRPESWVVVNQTEVAGATRFRGVHAMTHHDGRPVAWRLRFYKKVTGVWVFTNVAEELEFVEDFLRLPEVEFLAYRRLLERDEE